MFRTTKAARKMAWAGLLAAVLGLVSPAPARAQAQARGNGLTVNEIGELVRGGVASERIIRLAGEKCLAFRMESGAEAELRRTGGDAALIAGLRSACSTVRDSAAFRRSAPSVRAPVATGALDIPQIRGTVASVDFFESARTTPPVGQREFRPRFPQQSTRFVHWQLNLRYPRAGRRIEFPLEVIYYRQDGSVFSRNTSTIQIEPEWSGSAHASGMGWGDPGMWTAGVYRVEFVLEGRRIASGTFEIVSAGMPTAYVPAVSGTVTAVRFFESNDTLPRLDEEVFTTRFASSSSRYIYYRLDLKYPRASSRVDFPIQVVIVDASGGEYARFSMNTYVEAGWTSSMHRQGRGSRAPGSWPPGTYRMDFYQGGQRIATGSFDVY